MGVVFAVASETAKNRGTRENTFLATFILRKVTFYFEKKQRQTQKRSGTCSTTNNEHSTKTFHCRH